jgi:hypothetical protein
MAAKQSLADLIRQAKERRDTLKREIRTLEAERQTIERQPRPYAESMAFALELIQRQQALAIQNNPLLIAAIRNPGNATPNDLLADPILADDPGLALALLATPETIAGRFEPIIAQSCEGDPGISSEARSQALAKIDKDIGQRQSELASIEDGLAVAIPPPADQPVSHLHEYPRPSLNVGPE